MSADIPQPLQPVLNASISLVNDALPGLLAGLYLHGLSPLAPTTLD